MLKLVHEKYAKDKTERDTYLTEFAAAMDANANLQPLLQKVHPACPQSAMLTVKLWPAQSM